MKTLLALLSAAFLAGCSTTTVYRDGKPTFRTSASCATLNLGADGSLAMTGVDHAKTILAQGKAATSQITGLTGVVTALGASSLLH